MLTKVCLWVEVDDVMFNVPPSPRADRLNRSQVINWSKRLSSFSAQFWVEGWTPDEMMLGKVKISRALNGSRHFSYEQNWWERHLLLKRWNVTKLLIGLGRLGGSSWFPNGVPLYQSWYAGLTFGAGKVILSKSNFCQTDFTKIKIDISVSDHAWSNSPLLHGLGKVGSTPVMTLYILCSHWQSHFPLSAGGKGFQGWPKLTLYSVIFFQRGGPSW